METLEISLVIAQSRAAKDALSASDLMDSESECALPPTLSLADSDVVVESETFDQSSLPVSAS